MVPTPHGEIRLVCEPRAEGGTPRYTVELPEGVTGEFVGWGLREELGAGERVVE